jgi:hypothetical protein
MSYGINPDTGRCRQCGRAQVRLGTDGRGNVVDVPEPCACPKVAPKRTPAYRASVDAARRLACVCQLCDEPVHGKPKVSLYCEAHRDERRKAVVKKSLGKAEVKPWTTYYRRHHDKVLARERKRHQKNEAERERRNAYKRAWRKANRDKVRAQKERAALRNFRDPQPGVKRWRAQVEAGERKPTRARRNKHGERMCCNGLCRQVVEGHARMCERCKGRLAEEARQQLRRAA